MLVSDIIQEDRIVLNKFQIASLAKLYAFSKVKLSAEVDQASPSTSAGARTPMKILNNAKTSAQTAFNKVGDVFGKVAGDFTGRQISKSGSPGRVVLTLLQTIEGSQAVCLSYWSMEVLYVELSVCSSLGGSIGRLFKMGWKISVLMISRGHFRVKRLLLP